MSIRLRLTLCYSSLLALILIIVALFSYGVHARSHYEDLDQALVTSAGHAAAVYEMPNAPVLLTEQGGMNVVLQMYDASGNLVAGHASPGVASLQPAAILQQPAGPAYDLIASLAFPLSPRLPKPSQGVFGLLDVDGQRWRVYVLPLMHTGPTTGYVVALAPLRQLDASIQRYRVLLLVLGLAGVLAALAGSWWLAGRALQPVATLTATAQAIAQARSMNRRVPEPPQLDELGQLARTFNAMLTSLEEAQRAQERFVADASHELRAPLTAIQGNLELLRRQLAMPPHERAEALAEVERETRRLARLVADLLALARADAGVALVRRPVELDAVILDALRAAQPLAQGQTLQLEHIEPVQVYGDADRLKQLLLILLDNALKYTPPGGRVSVSLVTGTSYAVITITDTGIGIAAADLPYVFDRFYRADPARSRDPGGTGLGLPIAQWIVQQHGGSIELQSQVGQGTTATIHLPRLREAPHT